MWKQSIFSKAFHKYLCADSQNQAPDDVTGQILLALARNGSLFIACEDQQRTIQTPSPTADHDANILNALMAGCICSSCQRGDGSKCSAR